MGLVTTEEMFKKAYEGGYAIGDNPRYNGSCK